MNTNTTTHTIGLDLSDRKVAVCVLDRDGNIVEERSMPNEPVSYKMLAKAYPEASSILETGSHSPWVSRLLAAQGLKPVVANARKLRAIYQNDRKSDRNDARMLARIGRVDPSLLHPVRHRSEGAQRDLVRIKTRDALVSARVDMITPCASCSRGWAYASPAG